MRRIYIQGILKEFKDKPDDLEISPADRERFDTIFPHNTPGERWGIPQIRADDLVKVIAAKYVQAVQHEARERLWVQVLAVTSNGIVVGIMSNDIENPLLGIKNIPDDMTCDPDYHLHEGDLVSFPVTCVYGVEHGRIGNKGNRKQRHTWTSRARGKKQTRSGAQRRHNGGNDMSKNTAAKHNEREHSGQQG
jgi:hypothetical protein